jgi:hypothetical protein
MLMISSARGGCQRRVGRRRHDRAAFRSDYKRLADRRREVIAHAGYDTQAQRTPGFCAHSVSNFFKAFSSTLNQAGNIFIGSMKASFIGSPFENMPRKFVTDFHVHGRKKLRHGRIQAGHRRGVVHLPGVRVTGTLRLGQRRDLACLGQAADAFVSNWR